MCWKPAHHSRGRAIVLFSCGTSRCLFSRGHSEPQFSQHGEYSRRGTPWAARAPAAHYLRVVLGIIVIALALGSPARVLGADLPGATDLPLAAPATGVVPEDAAGIALPRTNETGFGVAAGVGETDNVRLASEHRESQTLAAANLDFTLSRSGTLLDVSALGNFSYIDYLQHAYRREFLGRLDGLAILKLWAYHLHWIVRDDYGESQLDVFAAVTPANLQRVNVVTTGPDLTLRPTEASFLELEGLYQRITYQTSPFDGDSLTGSLAVGRRVSPLSKLSLDAQVQRLHFDNTMVNTNFDRRELYGEYSIIGARTAIDAQLGATQADDTGPWKTSPLARLSLSRKVSPSSTVTLGGGREYTDAGGAFSDLTAGAAGGIAIGAVAQTTANYVRNYGSLGWTFSRLRTTFALTGQWERDIYDKASAVLYNATRTDAEFSLGRNLTRHLTGDVIGSWASTRYAHQGFTDRYGTVGAALTWHPGRWLEVYARYDHTFRRPGGAQAAISGGGYDEDRIFVMLGYRPHAAADEGAQAEPLAEP